MHLGNGAPGEIEAHARSSGGERLHVLPGHERFAREVGRARPQHAEGGVDGALPAHPPHQPAEADVDVRHAQLASRAKQVQVVDALHLGVVGVEDLPVEDVLRERNFVAHQLQRLERIGAALERRAVRSALDDVAPLDPPQLSARGAHAQRGDLRIGGLCSIGEEVDHLPEALAAGPERRPPEQVGEEDEGALGRR